VGNIYRLQPMEGTFGTFRRFRASAIADKVTCTTVRHSAVWVISNVQEANTMGCR